MPQPEDIAWHKTRLMKDHETFNESPIKIVIPNERV
jgi:hypothetical protein